MEVRSIASVALLFILSGVVYGHEEGPEVHLVPVADVPGHHNETDICPASLSDRGNLTTGALFAIPTQLQLLKNIPPFKNSCLTLVFAVTWFVVFVFLLTILIEIGTEKLNHVRY